MRTAKSIPRILTLATLAAFLLNFIAAIPAFGQGAGSAGSSITVTRTPYLSFISIPSSFAFSGVTADGAAQDVFSDADGALDSAARALEVRDTRNSGGFLVQAQATNFVSTTDPGDLFSAAALRAVSTTQFTIGLDGTIVNNVYYLSGYAGTPDAPTTQNASAPINTATTNFGQTATYDDVQNLPENNAFNAAVDIMSGCLPSTQGRVGTMAVGLAYNLTVPAYTVPGDYASTITYTITDFTQPVCP